MYKFNPVTHVIFDCDGLLLNTEDVYEQMDTELVARYGKKYPASVRLKVLGISEKNALETIVNDLELPITAEQYHDEREEMAKQRLPHVEFLPGVVDLVQHLFRMKVPMAIATGSSIDTFHIKMSRHKDFFDKYFSHFVVAADPEVKHGKPAPDIFLTCAKRFADQPAPSKCLVFEDSYNGVMGAIRAGMQVVMIPPPCMPDEKKKSATLTLDSMKEFKPEWFHLPPFQ